MPLSRAAAAIGVSVETLRRWDRAGKLRTRRDERGRRWVPASEVARLEQAPQRHRTGTSGSARNRFPGVVRSVEVGGVMALVEIEAGPHPGHGRDHPRLGSRAGPRAGRTGDGARQGDVRDGRARGRMRRPSRTRETDRRAPAGGKGAKGDRSAGFDGASGTCGRRGAARPLGGARRLRELERRRTESLGGVLAEKRRSPPTRRA